MQNETYNGYTNYETWTVMLIINNTESLYNFFKKIVEGIKKSEEKENWIYAAAAAAKHVVEETKPTTNNDIWNQLIMHDLESKINFYEIGQALIENYD